MLFPLFHLMIDIITSFGLGLKNRFATAFLQGEYQQKNAEKNSAFWKG